MDMDSELTSGLSDISTISGLSPSQPDALSDGSGSSGTIMGSVSSDASSTQDGGEHQIPPVSGYFEEDTITSDGFLSNARLQPTYTSSFLRPGSKFVGTQQSDRQNYKVEVEMKHVDMGASFLCGYLRIEGLTADHPTLTTYFEGEIIGPKYTFRTHHEEWGATHRTDMQHWARFPAFRPLRQQAQNPEFHYTNFHQRENIFMRWKEAFLVPDHRVRDIIGASFEGFYYICFNQVNGTVSGIYFHAKSEKFQQLELTHVPDKGCFGAIEFR